MRISNRRKHNGEANTDIDYRHDLRYSRGTGFICAYCGSKPPEVILHVDHIKAIAKGGDSGIDKSCNGLFWMQLR